MLNPLVAFIINKLGFLRASPEAVHVVSLSALAVTFVTSLVLTYIMIRYKGKRPVDISVMLREIAFILVVFRLFIALAFDDPLNIWAMVVYLFLGLSVTMLLYLTIREQWFPPPIVETPEQLRLKECELELKELKENSDGNEEV